MEGVHIVNAEDLKRKIKQFNKNNFHLVSDFDSTLTQSFVNGERVHSSYSYVRGGDYLSKDFFKRSITLTEYYRPIEFDPNVPQKEKDEKMVEWWTKHYDLLIECDMHIEVIKEIVEGEKILLRKGSSEFFDLVKKYDIPLLIFSAGLGNLIEEFLKAKGNLTKRTHIISNFLVFDEEGKAVSYVRPLIHTFNKKEVQIKDLPYQKEILEKKNVILLGDHIGDVTMCHGVDHDCMIKIGFLNEDADKLMDSYAQHFDVIIINDGSMDYVNNLLKEILE
ncbi:hypothetical protein ACFLZB_04800 [Nanoarchaeota archaeon]